MRQNNVAVLLPRELRGGTLPIQKVASGRFRQQIGELTIEQRFRDAVGAASSAILSDENILGSARDREMRRTGVFYPDGHRRLARILGALGLAKVPVFLCVRDPATFIVSAFSQHVKSRGFVPFEEFLGGLDVCMMYWSDLMERLLDVPGVSRVIIWKYEDYPAVAGRIFTELLPDGLGASVIAPADKVNTGLSAPAYALLTQMHFDGEDIDSKRAKAVREAFPKSSDNAAFAPFDEVSRADSLAFYSEDIDEIATNERVTLLSP